jgi:hypothetical protein
MNNAKDIALAAVKCNPHFYLNLPTELQRDPDICLKAVEAEGELYTLIPQDLMTDHDLLAAAIRSDPEIAGFSERVGVRWQGNTACTYALISSCSKSPRIHGLVKGKCKEILWSDYTKGSLHNLARMHGANPELVNEMLREVQKSNPAEFSEMMKLLYLYEDPETADEIAMMLEVPCHLYETCILKPASLK